MWGALNSFRSSADWLSYTTLAFDWFMVACRSKVAVEKACYGHVTEALAVVTSQRGSRKLGRDLSLLTQRWWMVQWSFACFPVHFFCANWLQQLSGRLSEKSDPLFQSFFQKKNNNKKRLICLFEWSISCVWAAEIRRILVKTGFYGEMLSSKCPVASIFERKLERKENVGNNNSNKSKKKENGFVILLRTCQLMRPDSMLMWLEKATNIVESGDRLAHKYNNKGHKRW